MDNELEQLDDPRPVIIVTRKGMYVITAMIAILGVVCVSALSYSFTETGKVKISFRPLDQFRLFGWKRSLSSHSRNRTSVLGYRQVFSQLLNGEFRAFLAQHNCEMYVSTRKIVVLIGILEQSGQEDISNISSIADLLEMFTTLRQQYELQCVTESIDNENHNQNTNISATLPSTTGRYEANCSSISVSLKLLKERLAVLQENVAQNESFVNDSLTNWTFTVTKKLSLTPTKNRKKAMRHKTKIMQKLPPRKHMITSNVSLKKIALTITLTDNNITLPPKSELNMTSQKINETQTVFFNNTTLVQ